MELTKEICPKHLERCQQEATRDVIFLFQRRRLTWTGNLPSHYEFDGYGHVFAKGADRETAEPITLDKMLREHGSEYVIERWDTECVWMDRKEATAWGHEKSYNYSDGWRVYGVPADGELAAMLRGGSALRSPSPVTLPTHEGWWWEWYGEKWIPYKCEMRFEKMHWWWEGVGWKPCQSGSWLPVDLPPAPEGVGR